jgi:hypothetical protein
MAAEVITLTIGELRRMIISAFIFGFSLRNLMVWIGLLWRLVSVRPCDRELVSR